MYTASLDQISAYDWIVLLIVLLSMCLGIVRGMTREIASLCAWIGAFALGRFASEPLANRFATSFADSPLRLPIIFILLFVSGLIAINLLGQWLAQAMRRVGLGTLDRLLGGLFGALRAALILLVLVLLAAATGVNEQRGWKAALCTGVLERAAQGALPALPPALAERIHLRGDRGAAAAFLHWEG